MKKVVFVNPSKEELKFFLDASKYLDEDIESYWITYDFNRVFYNPNIYYVNTDEKITTKVYDTEEILGISLKQIILGDRLFKDKRSEFINQIYEQVESILRELKPDLVYTGVGGEIIRSAVYYLSCSGQIATAIHGYYGVKNRIVFFDNPISYNLYEINNSNAVEDNEEFRKLDPEVRNINIQRYLIERFKKASNITPQKILNFSKDTFNIVLRNVRRLILEAFIYQNTEEIEENNKYLFPMHLSDDFVIDILNYQYKDQVKLIFEILDVIPNDKRLIIKEHPYDMYAYSVKTYFKIKKCGGIFINPIEDSMDVLRSCKEGLITICSTFAIEAGHLNLPIYLLGNSFYKKYNFARIGYEKTIFKEKIDLKTQKEEFEKFMTLFNKNSFKAPLPYLDKPIDVSKDYAKAISILLDNLKEPGFNEEKKHEKSY